MILCENLVKIYKTNEIEVVALQGLDLKVKAGELMAIIGNSGSGKSTLLNILGGLDRPSAGNLYVDGMDLLKFSDKELVKYKRETVGFVWQNNARNLISYLTAKENVELPMMMDKRPGRKRDKARDLLDMVGLSHKENSKLEQLSGGEQQRVAIAIALSNNPKLLLADEPTGALDSNTAWQILDLFRKLNNDLGLTVVIVTHDRQISGKVDRVVAIRDGRTSSEFIRMPSYEKASGGQDTENILGHDDGRSLKTHIELAVLDKAGRLQIPREYLEQLNMMGTRKVKVELEDGKIVILNPEAEVN